MPERPAKVGKDAEADDASEERRLAALQALDILDTPPEAGFDRIVRLIQNIFDVPIALVSMMDRHRQWHKACVGLGGSEVDRHQTFCRFPVRSGQPMVVVDTHLDPRFSEHPFVVGGPKLRFYAGAPLKTIEGLTIGTLCAIDLKPREFDATDLAILCDLSAIVMSEIALRHTAETDMLTKVLSRRAFKAQAERAAALARRHGQPLTAIMLDIDHFKSVNDTHGHPAGDKVLTAVADTCRAALRRTDMIGRLGGEEFALLLPNTDEAGALDVAEKLRDAIRRQSVDFGRLALRVTASFGIAGFHGQGLEALLGEADRALYEAKQQGRDRAVTRRRATES